MFIPPPLLLLVAIGASYLVSVLFPDLQFANVTTGLIGICLLTLGFGLFLWAGKTLRAHKTTLHPRGKPKKLVTHGPYRISRNPIYLGFLMVTMGTSLLFANVLAFVGPIIFLVFVSMFVIPYEEAMLSKLFGKSYKSYVAKIRRWV